MQRRASLLIAIKNGRHPRPMPPMRQILASLLLLAAVVSASKSSGSTGPPALRPAAGSRFPLTLLARSRSGSNNVHAALQPPLTGPRAEPGSRAEPMVDIPILGLIFTQRCWDVFLTNGLLAGSLDIFDMACIKITISKVKLWLTLPVAWAALARAPLAEGGQHAAAVVAYPRNPFGPPQGLSWGIVVFSGLLKAPQIYNIIQSGSVEGVAGATVYARSVSWPARDSHRRVRHGPGGWAVPLLSRANRLSWCLVMWCAANALYFDFFGYLITPVYGWLQGFAFSTCAPSQPPPPPPSSRCAGQPRPVNPA